MSQFQNVSARSLRLSVQGQVDGSCQPVSSGDDAKTHRQGHHALSLLRERKNAPGLLDTERIQPQWIWNSASIGIAVSILILTDLHLY